MTDTEYRRYTTAELRDMPDTARLEDKRGKVYGTSRFVSCRRHNRGWATNDIGLWLNCELARRLLRRLA
jgi:hypothetical protein